MALSARDQALVEMLRERGVRFPQWTVVSARQVGIPLSYALAFLEKESSGRDTDGSLKIGLNLFGSDPVHNPVKGGFVTQKRYRTYVANRKRGLGMQGVGPLQLTWWEFQDMADKEGGCWHPQHNMRVGFAIAKRLIKDHGKGDGVRRWNGEGPAAEHYSEDWASRQRKWRRILADVEAKHGAAGDGHDAADEGHDAAPHRKAGDPRPLRLTSPLKRGPDVRRLQKALNQRARALGYPPIDVDGEYGPMTAASVRRIGWRLGALEGTLDQGATLGLQAIIEDPGRRNGDQLARAKKRRAQAKSAKGGAARAVKWAEAQVGTLETPAGSNRGPKVTRWQAEFGNPNGGWPWCGAFVGYALRHYGGVPVGSGIVYTPNILSWARSRTGGFDGLYPFAQAKPGDLVLMRFTSGGDPVQHVAIYAGHGVTIEGNTSSGTAGSQDNGGGVFRRQRPASVVVGCARPRY
jgi:hypothetical protein